MALSMPLNDSERLDDIRASCQRIATFGDCTSSLKSLPHEPPLLHDWLSITNLERDWLASGGIAGNFVEVLRDQFVQCGRPLADSNAAAQTGVTSGLDQHQRLGLISTATAIVLTLRFFRTLPLDRPPDIDSMKRDATGYARRGSRGNSTLQFATRTPESMISRRMPRSSNLNRGTSGRSRSLDPVGP